jgi:hypothetical protein
VASGPVNCAGQIVFDNPSDYLVVLSDGCVSWTFCSGCSEWLAETLAEWQEDNQHLLDGPNHTTTLRVMGGTRPCEEGDE